MDLHATRRIACAGALLAVASIAVAQGPVLRTPAADSHPAAAPAASDTKPAGTATTLSVDARLVNIPVVVRDKHGALVQTLTKDNFVLNVDDRPQTIRYFNVDKDLPLTLGLLVDTSLSQRDAIDDEQKASAAFLDDMLNGPPDRDKAFIIQFSRQTELLQDTTSSKPKLQAGLKELGTPGSGGGAPQAGGGNGNPDGSVTLPDDSDSNRPGRPRMRGAGTTLYDALFLSSDELMSKLKGRKAVIILSDGVDNGSKETLASSIEAAQRADTIVYAIYYKGRGFGGEQDRGRQGGGYPGRRGGGYPGGGGGYPGGGGGGGGGQRRQPQQSQVDGRKMLQRMADETGGRLFEVSKKETVADIYKQIGEELRAQYRLGYSPDKDTASDGYHRIDLSLSKATGKEKDYFLQTRDGYYVGH